MIFSITQTITSKNYFLNLLRHNEYEKDEKVELNQTFGLEKFKIKRQFLYHQLYSNSSLLNLKQKNKQFFQACGITCCGPLVTLFMCKSQTIDE